MVKISNDSELCINENEWFGASGGSPLETARAMGWVWSPSGTGPLPGPPGKMIPTQDPPHGAWSPLGPLCQHHQTQFRLGKGAEGKGRIPRCLDWGCFPKLM